MSTHKHCDQCDQEIRGRGIRLDSLDLCSAVCVKAWAEKTIAGMQEFEERFRADYPHLAHRTFVPGGGKVYGAGGQQ